MRLKVHQLRIALIALNLVLAGSAALYAFSKYKNLIEKKPSVPIVDARTLVMKEGTGDIGPTGVNKMANVDGLNPKPPPPVDSPPPELPTGEADPADGTGDDPDMPLGPLGDHWVYAWYILHEDDPLENLVTLRKKDAAAQSSPAGGAASKAGVRPRPTIRPSRSNLAGQRKAGAVQAPGDTMTFVVKSRKGKDETTDPPVEFMIHSADAKRFVYWMPDDPKKMYALPRDTDSPYDQAPEEGLRPRPKPEGEVGEEEKQKKHFRIRPEKWELNLEDEYKEMLEGKPAGANMKLIGPEEVSGDEAAKDVKESRASSSKKPVSSSSSGKAGQPRTTMTDEEKEQLQKVFKSPKMTAKDRAELEKVLMGGKKK